MANTPTPTPTANLSVCEKQQLTIINLLILLVKTMGVKKEELDKAIVK